MSRGWIGVDLDGTLATYDHWRGPEHIGEPIAPIVNLVKTWLAQGKEVRIYTARVSGTPEEVAVAQPAIEAWCQEVIGKVLPVTCKKDYGMVFCVDDRAKQVIPNAGILLEELLDHMGVST
ncbi:hypothetical protein EVB78_032 [Rhizobium phage RHph_N1_15]|nr:hypothetical protein EVB78_032 [Rhizobium phage RHph_N1_15]QIG75094.1 hypothetical protein EVC15_032 [Rhizobium phage RHph_N2_6]